MEKTRLRIRFTKCGDLRWISHRDLARVWERLLRRANLELAFSEGFHPKPRISFPSALALGIEALDEVVELEVVGQVHIHQIENDIRRELPVGMELLSLESPSYALGKAKVLGADYRVTLADATTPQEREAVRARIDDVNGRDVLEIDRDGKSICCNPRDPHFALLIEGDFLIFSLPNVAQGSVRPSELLAAIGLGHLLDSGATLQRTAVHLHEPSSQ